MFQCRCDSARSGDVVLFNQYAIVQAHAVVHAAADHHCVLLRETQSWDGFARIDHMCFCACNRFDIGVHGGGCAREQLQKIQCGTLGRDQCACRARHFNQDLIGFNRIALRHVPSDLNARFNLAKRRIKPRLAAENRRLTRNDAPVGLLLGVNQERGQIARADVFIQSALNVCGNAIGGREMCGHKCFQKTPSIGPSIPKFNANMGLSSRPTCKTALPPCFINNNRGCVGQVQAAVVRHHRQANALRAREKIAHRIGQTCGF